MTSKEALERLKFIADKELNTGSKSYKDLQEFWNYKEPLEVIEKLVERDTPMKVNLRHAFDNPFSRLLTQFCPNCGEMIYEKTPKFCEDCGQRLDWGVEK